MQSSHVFIGELLGSQTLNVVLEIAGMVRHRWSIPYTKSIVAHDQGFEYI